MPIVWIPSLMRDLTGGASQIEVQGQTLGQVMDALDRAYPGVKARVCEGGRIHPSIAVCVDGRTTKLGVVAPVGEHSEIHFLPMMAGG